MGGIASPSTKLVKTPAPASQFPNVANSLQGFLTALSGGAQKSLGGLMEGKVPDVTGSVMPAYNAMVDASKRQVGEGQAQIMEKFATSGGRFGSGAARAVGDYQSQVSKDFASILSQFMLGTQGQVMGSELGAIQAFLGSATGLASQTYPTAALVSGPSPLSQIGSLAQGGAEGLALLHSLEII